MAVFEYKAVGAGAAVGGTIVADTPRQARESLRDRGLIVTEVRTLNPRQAGIRTARIGQRGRIEITSLIREMATLLRAGIPLLSALQTLSSKRRKRFKAVVEHLADRVAAGVDLAEAMAEQPAYFDEFCVNIVRVGESTGHLESSLKRLAEFRDKASRLHSRVTTALIYPAVVCMVGLAVTVFLMTYVVPNLLNTLIQSGRELPAVTRIVKGISDLLIGWWWAILAGGVLLAAAVRLLLRMEGSRLLFDRMLLRVPVIGELVRKENTSRMSVIMAALLQSGLQFVEAVRITRRTLRNRTFRAAMDAYEAAVSAGRDVAAPLEATGIFSPTVVQMLAVGQQSGQLEEMLEQLSEAYDQEVATATQRLTAVLEPTLIVFLAILVGFVAFATVLPILEASNAL